MEGLKRRQGLLRVNVLKYNDLIRKNPGDIPSFFASVHRIVDGRAKISFFIAATTYKRMDSILDTDEIGLDNFLFRTLWKD